MFTNQNYQGGYDNLQDIFYSQHGANESQCAFLNPHLSQNPFNLPQISPITLVHFHQTPIILFLILLIQQTQALFK